MEREDTAVEAQTEVTRREGPGDRAHPPGSRLERGAAVGRYLIVGVLGEGGMGVVYSAYDPELDRKVAIKLLQANVGSSTGDQGWLLREAQAMARLSHPNVIAVHDVGVLPGDRVFVAMELVEGPTLRAWLRERQRPWHEVLAILRAAGSGLAAAHAAGLVHRDFKPDNVLVGNDGRVRVLDFGLARLQAAEPGDPAVPDVSDGVEVHSPLSASMTAAGTLAGTPAYMAPELTTGAGADARSDQFSFGVSLYEALFRARPFRKDSPRDKPAPEPGRTKVPARIQRVVMRAISPVAADRFASMDELLKELVDVGLARKRGLVAGALALGVGGAAVIGLAVASRSEPVKPCVGIEHRLAGIWDPGTRQAVRLAFANTKLPYATLAITGLEPQLDRYATEWTASVVDSCEATRIRGDQTEEVLTLRQMCFDQRLDELGALTRLLVTADAGVVGNSAVMTAGLEPVSLCSNVAALRAPGQPPTEPRAKLDELHRYLAEAKAALAAARYVPSITLAKQAAALADEVHYPPYKAEALVVQCAANNGASNPDSAIAACADAVWLGLSSRRDDLVAKGATSAAALTAQVRIGEGRLWLRLAKSIAQRNGVDPTRELRLLEVEGMIAGVEGDLAAAVELHGKALATAERVYGADDPRLWADEEVIGTTLMRAGAFEKARPHLERAIALHERVVGPDHPDIATVLTNLGACYTNIGDDDGAKRAYERALAIREHSDGESPMLILTLNNMADGMIKAKNPSGALIYSARAAGLAAKLLGRNNPVHHAVATTHAEALVASGQIEAARARYDEIIAMETEVRSPVLGPTLGSRAAFELTQKRWADAASFASRSIQGMEQSSGKESPDLVQPLVTLARADLELGRRSEARPVIERAIAIGTKAQLSAADLAPAIELQKRAAGN